MAVDERGFPGEPNDNLTATAQRPEQLADFVETARLLIRPFFRIETLPRRTKRFKSSVVGSITRLFSEAHTKRGQNSGAIQGINCYGLTCAFVRLLASGKGQRNRLD
jgi:hypothetical protein